MPSRGEVSKEESEKGDHKIDSGLHGSPCVRSLRLFFHRRFGSAPIGRSGSHLSHSTPTPSSSQQLSFCSTSSFFSPELRPPSCLPQLLRLQTQVIPGRPAPSLLQRPLDKNMFCQKFWSVSGSPNAETYMQPPSMMKQAYNSLLTTTAAKLIQKLKFCQVNVQFMKLL